MKPIDIDRYLGAGLCTNLTGEGWGGVTGDTSGKVFARDRIQRGPRQGVLWALAGNVDSILRAGGVAVLVGPGATSAETNKNLLCSLENTAGAAWMLSLAPWWFVGLSPGFSACVA